MLGMGNEKKKTPRALDLRDLVREVLNGAREESAQKSGAKTEAEPQRQPEQS
jgi:hypothetical protein